MRAGGSARGVGAFKERACLVHRSWQPVLRLSLLDKTAKRRGVGEKKRKRCRASYLFAWRSALGGCNPAASHLLVRHVGCFPSLPRLPGSSSVVLGGVAGCRVGAPPERLEDGASEGGTGNGGILWLREGKGGRKGMPTVSKTGDSRAFL